MKKLTKIMGGLVITVTLSACESYSAPNPKDCYTQVEMNRTVDHEKFVPTTYCLDKQGTPKVLSRSGTMDSHQEAQLRKIREQANKQRR